MKLILAAALFATLAAPVAAPAQPAATAGFENAFSLEGLAERRSGRCPKRGAGVMREGSACGGV